jgi:hypothetical protein
VPAAETPCFFKKFYDRQSPKKEDYVSEWCASVWALHSWMIQQRQYT